jgi:hypothetical protein
MSRHGRCRGDIGEAHREVDGIVRQRCDLVGIFPRRRTSRVRGVRVVLVR